MTDVEWKPKDQLALIVAVGLISWGLIALVGSIWRSKPFSETGAEFFLTIGGALVAMLVTYFALKNGNGK